MIINNIEKFIQKAKLIHGNKYDYSEAVYKDHKTKVKIKCNICGNSFLQTIRHHIIGKGCPYCGKKKAGNKPLTKETFIKKAISKHGNTYDYSLIDYIDTKTKVKIKCNKCGNIFFQTPNGHLSGRGCSVCGREKALTRKLTTKEFIRRAKEIHGNKYNYSNCIYIAAHKKVKIFCNRCKSFFEQQACQHLSGSNCPCYKTKTTDIFIDEAKKIHKNRYDYSEVIYKRSTAKVKIFCKKCKKYFMQTPCGHLSGRGCPYCCESKAEVAIKDWLSTNNIIYKFQHKFSDCKDQHSLIFDFYLPNYNTCIEYQGKQHFCIDFYSIIRRKYNGKEKEAFELQQKHDQIKRDYCKNNSIKLLEITYKDNIEKVLIDWFNKL